MKVRVYDHLRAGPESQRIIGYLWTEDGIVKATPECMYLLDKGYKLREPRPHGRLLGKHDGDEFLKLFPQYYTGTGLRADIVSADA